MFAKFQCYVLLTKFMKYNHKVLLKSFPIHFKNFRKKKNDFNYDFT